MKIAPSVLTADFTNLKEELRSIETADYVHLDIMDGHFVPNISFGPAIAKQIQKNTDLPLDIHLMVTDPLKWIDQFAIKNTEFITIHVESNDVMDSIKKIKGHHIGVGLSIKPKTPVADLLPYIEQAKLILVMTVEPGFGGQSFIAETMEKVRELVRIRDERKLFFGIEVDGGINQETIQYCRESGVDIAVAGSYLFNQKDRKKGILSLK
ncbi:MAG: ribulose-phosphate 3-epimerase [Tenericutes bacterium HGW-Tenericutes-3]|nr:MAG: ribulose-phosphate 3-epimerase [Tenericutes bacterium HGW-Tenericutes-3]